MTQSTSLPLISNSASMLLNKVYDMYADIRLGVSDICEKCKVNPFWGKDGIQRIGPVPIYHVGNNYSEQNKKIVFVASVGYGWDDELPRQAMDYTNLKLNERNTLIYTMRNRQTQLYNVQMSIYRCVHMFCSQYFGNPYIGFENICLLNIIHCNRGDVGYFHPKKIRDCCAHSDAGFRPFCKTLAILKPDIILGICTIKDNDYLKKCHIDVLQSAKKKCFTYPGRKNIQIYVNDLIKFC